MSVNFHDPNQITDQEVLLSLGVVVVVMIVVDPETFLGHVNAAHSERRMSGGAEAWRAVKPRPPPGEDAAGVDTLEATVDTAAGKGKRGRTSDPPGKIRGTPATLLAPPDFTNDGVGSSPASASWEEGAMEAERLYLDNKRRRLDAPTETEAASPERPPAPRNLSFASGGGGGGQRRSEPPPPARPTPSQKGPAARTSHSAHTSSTASARLPTTMPAVTVELDSLALPTALVDYLRAEKKISRLYPWQAECLAMPGVMAHTRNLVYCAPTSGGKSLVSDLLVVRRLIAGGCDGGAAMALMVLPFVSLCQERSTELTRMLKPLGIEVRGFFGGRGGALPPRGGAGGLIVATPEKANDLVTRLVAEDRIHELACVVVDELHMVQDVSRGSTVELMLTKLMHAAAESSYGGDASMHEYSGSPEVGARGKGENEDDRKPEAVNLASPLSGASSERDPAAAPPPLQVIGMSATLPNLDALARWLGDAALFETDFRPVPLRSHVVVGDRAYPVPEREAIEFLDAHDDPLDAGGARDLLNPLASRSNGTTSSAPAGCTELDAVEALASETVRRGGGGVIVFCAARFQCEMVARALSQRLRVPGADTETNAPLASLVEDIRRVTGDEPMVNRSDSTVNRADSTNKTLAECASLGVAWHHAGLHPEARTLVERGFRENSIQVICCTTTMATGVNLPASRVVIHGAYQYRKGGRGHALIGSRDLQQMVGRAGRAGFATLGEAFVIAPKPNEIDWCSIRVPSNGQPRDRAAVARELGRRLVSSGDALSSRIAKEGMRRVMLDAVACGLANTPREIRRYVSRTLLAALNDFQDVVAADATAALAWLARGGFTVWDQHAFRWEPTALGRAAAAAHLTPDAAVRVVNDVRLARRRLILESDLHLLFLCVEPEPAAPAVGRDAARGSNETKGANAPREPETCSLDEVSFIKIYESLSEHEGRVANAVGIKADYVEGRLRLGRKDVTPEHGIQRRVCLRFLHALALKDLVSEVDHGAIVASFGLKTSARLTQLQESAGRYAGQVASVCGPMGWGDMEVLVARLQDRITAGAREEILCLTHIPQVGASRARTLYNHGARTPEAIAALSREDLVKILRSRGPFERAPGRAADAILRGARQLCEEQRRATREESEAKLRELEKLAPIESFDDKENARQPSGADGEVTLTDGEPTEEVDPSLDVDAARGCVVVRHPRALASLLDRWRRESHYAFVFQPGKGAAEEGHASDASPPDGVALCFASNPRATFFVPVVHGVTVRQQPLGNTTTTTCAEKEWTPRGWPWSVVRDVLRESTGARKATVDLKPQLRAMGAADRAAAKPSLSAAASSFGNRPKPSCSIGVVGGEVVDVRVAGWLLRPDAADLACAVTVGWAKIGEELTKNSSSVKKSLAETILRFYHADGVNAASVRAAARWTLGRTRTSRSHASAASAAMTAAACLAADVAAIVPRLGSAGVKNPNVQDAKLGAALRDAEMRLVPALAQMEATGVAFDPSVLCRQIRQANRRLCEIEREADALVSAVSGAEPASLASSADVARVLFEDLKLPPPPCAVVQCGGGRRRLRANAEVLAALKDQSDLPALVLEHRTLSRCVAMADEMVELALGGARRDEGKLTRLRGAIHQTNTETGRLAMEEPNLQTVPKPRTFRMADAYDGIPGIIEEGRAKAQSREPSPGTEVGSEETLSVRNAFVAPPGAVLLSADYRQLELRVMAHMSGDEGLVQAFNHEGVPPHHPDADPFRFLASRWQGVEKGMVSDADRAVAKQVSDEQSVTRFPSHPISHFLSFNHPNTNRKGTDQSPPPKNGSSRTACCTAPGPLGSRRRWA